MDKNTQRLDVTSDTTIHQAIPEVRRIVTGNYKAIARRAVRDRWVWLALGVLLFLVSLIVGATAHAADVGPVVAEADPLVDMIRTSGPAGGMVLVLGYFIRTWQADFKMQSAKTEAALERLSARIEAAHTSDSIINTTIASLKGDNQTVIAKLQAENHELFRRVDRLERRASGTHRKAEE